MLAGWAAMLVYDLHAPVLLPSLDGERPHCWLEVLLAALPGFALGWLTLRRLWPLSGAWSGGLLGLAAGVMPALIMSLACMSEPRHILLFHLIPGLLFGLAGALLGARALRTR